MDRPQALLLPLADAGQGPGADVGAVQLLGRACEDPRNVERHVPLADNGSSFPRPPGFKGSMVRVTVIPLHELWCPIHTSQLFPRYTQCSLALSSNSHDDGIVLFSEQAERHGCPDLDVPEEAEARCSGHIAKVVDHIFHLRVIGCDSKPHKAKRYWKSFEHVDMHRHLLSLSTSILEQVLRCVKRRRPTTNNRHMIVAVLRTPQRSESSARGEEARPELWCQTGASHADKGGSSLIRSRLGKRLGPSAA
mmetsp:Transcript_48598/g.126750  ORF Transcript_48598/g.126750 Transcript_48598/m.126750 type:complete len:250 (+) Transcript_48598:793-1542(+)